MVRTRRVIDCTILTFLSAEMLFLITWYWKWEGCRTRAEADQRVKSDGYGHSDLYYLRSWSYGCSRQSKVGGQRNGVTSKKQCMGTAIRSKSCGFSNERSSTLWVNSVPTLKTRLDPPVPFCTENSLKKCTWRLDGLNQSPRCWNHALALSHTEGDILLWPTTLFLLKSEWQRWMCKTFHLHHFLGVKVCSYTYQSPSVKILCINMQFAISFNEDQTRYCIRRRF